MHAFNLFWKLAPEGYFWQNYVKISFFWIFRGALYPLSFVENLKCLQKFLWKIFLENILKLTRPLVENGRKNKYKKKKISQGLVLFLNMLGMLYLQITPYTNMM